MQSNDLVNWANPYDVKGTWLKGNLHTHTVENSPCGVMPLKDAIQRYAALKYDFLCISDHMKLTQPKAGGSRLVFLPGTEWNSSLGEHTTVCAATPAVIRPCLDIAEQAELLNHLTDKPALVILNHPNWMEPEHYSRVQLMNRPQAAGMEIYNGVIDVLSGTSLATEKWDYLLSRGRRILGFAADDAHALDHIGQAWIVAKAEARTPQAIFAALRRGSFYCSTGVAIRNIQRTGMRFRIESKDADEIWAIGDQGVRLARAKGSSMDFDWTPHKSSYVRFTLFGRGPAMAWTQPFFMATPLDKDARSPFITSWRISSIQPHRLSNAPAVTLNDNLNWKEVDADPRAQGFVDIRRRGIGNEDGIVYLANRFSVKETGDWIVSLGHDGGIRAFLDGKEVVNQPVLVNPAQADRSPFTTRLERGMHEIVVALNTDYGMGQGIFLRFIRVDSGSRRPSPFPALFKGKGK